MLHLSRNVADARRGRRSAHSDPRRSSHLGGGDGAGWRRRGVECLFSAVCLDLVLGQPVELHTEQAQGRTAALLTPGGPGFLNFLPEKLL